MGGKRYFKNAKNRSLIVFNDSYSKKPLYKCMRLNDKWDNQKLEKVSYEIYNSESGIPLHPISQLQEIGLESLNSLNLILPQMH